MRGHGERWGGVYHAAVSTRPAGGIEGRLRVMPIGVGTAYSAYGLAQASFLVSAGERRILLDAGAGSLNRLQRHLDPARLDAVVISHLHADHCADLLALHVYLAWGPGAGARIPVLGPAELRERLVRFTGSDNGWEVLEFASLAQPGGSRDLGDGLRLSWQEVPHTDPTFAIRMDWGGSSVCYGADCGPNDTLAAFAEGVDLLILECSFGAEPIPDGVPHLNAAEAARIAAASRARRVLLTHCYPEYARPPAVAEVAERVDGPVEFARQDVEVVP
jgi:ribonuclease BN (tRNA processing enzyme)